MRDLLSLTLKALAAATAVAAIVVVAMPLWLLLRVPGAVSAPEPELRQP